MPTDQELMNIHVSVLFTYNAESRLLFVNEPNGAPIPAPRLFLGQTCEGNIWRFRADVPKDLVKELDALCGDEPPISGDFNQPPRHLKTFVRLLELHAPVENVSSGPAYQFTEYNSSSKHLVAIKKDNSELLQGKFEELIPDVSVEQPFVAFVEGDRAVSVCRSVRITPEAHEAGVETLPDFRRRGYAEKVAAKWARRVRDSGFIPLYSTSWENHASQAVARKLRLKLYGTDFQIV